MFTVHYLVVLAHNYFIALIGDPVWCKSSTLLLSCYNVVGSFSFKHTKAYWIVKRQSGLAVV